MCVCVCGDRGGKKKDTEVKGRERERNKAQFHRHSSIEAPQALNQALPTLDEGEVIALG